MKSASQKERLNLYLTGIPELHDPMLLKEYFKSYHFRKEEEKMLEFWRKSIAGLYKYAYSTATLTKHKIKSSFMINRVVPYGLDNIILELTRRGYLIPLEDLRSRKYYQQREEKMGWVKWSLWKVYNVTFGLLWQRKESIPDTVALVSSAFLKSLWKKLMSHLHKKDMFLLDSVSLKKEMNDLGIPDSTKEIMLIHFEEVGYLHKFTIGINNEQVDCYKISEEIYPAKGAPYVSTKERASIMLQLNIQNISTKLDTLERKILGSHQEAVKMVHMKRKEVAKYLLKQKHMFQSYWEKFAILKYQLENQLLKIDTLEANDNLIKAFKLAEAAHKSIKTDLKEVEEVLENIDMRMEEQEEIHAVVQQHANMVLGGTDEEVLKELEELGEETKGIEEIKEVGQVSEAKFADKRVIKRLEESPEKEEEKVMLNS